MDFIATLSMKDKAYQSAALLEDSTVMVGS
jgi:hypothetical protein